MDLLQLEFVGVWGIYNGWYITIESKLYIVGKAGWYQYCEENSEGYSQRLLRSFDQKSSQVLGAFFTFKLNEDR